MAIYMKDVKQHIRFDSGKLKSQEVLSNLLICE